VFERAGALGQLVLGMGHHWHAALAHGQRRPVVAVVGHHPPDRNATWSHPFCFSTQ
jgi:hypothetical protein